MNGGVYMGILDNFKKIGDYMGYVKKERTLEQEVIKASIEDNTFYTDYNSFVNGLTDKLNYLLEEEGFKMVQFTPRTVGDAKFFLATMQDSLFTDFYKIEKTASGDFQYELLTLTV